MITRVPTLTFLIRLVAPAVCALARGGRLSQLPIEERPLAAAQAALDDLRAGRVVGRVVLVT